MCVSLKNKKKTLATTDEMKMVHRYLVAGQRPSISLVGTQRVRVGTQRVVEPTLVETALVRGLEVIRTVRTAHLVGFRPDEGWG